MPERNGSRQMAFFLPAAEAMRENTSKKIVPFASIFDRSTFGEVDDYFGPVITLRQAFSSLWRES
jgi:hypothetical protein